MVDLRSIIWMPATILVAALAVLAWCPAALAHGGGVPGFTSTVTSVQPAGVTVEVRDGDDRLRLENRSGAEVVVQGYDGEPYLRFAPDGVHRNANSPATYVNDDRYGQVEVPASADPRAAPRWEKVADSEVYEWHDHRIHWMSPESPPQVRTAPDRPHHVFDWQVPARAGGTPFVVTGSLDYAPPAASGSLIPYIAAPVAALALAAGLLVWRRSRRPRTGQRVAR